MDYRYSHQAYLQQAVGQLAHAGGARRTFALLVSLIALFVAAIAPARAASALPNEHVEAARSTWDSASPPDSGWVDVTLPDDWTTR